MFNKDIEDFIRDEESGFRDDDMVVAVCSECGERIRIGEDMSVYYSSESGAIHLCESCYNHLTPDEFAELLGIWNYTGDASKAEGHLAAHQACEEASG